MTLKRKAGLAICLAVLGYSSALFGQGRIEADKLRKMSPLSIASLVGTKARLHWTVGDFAAYKNCALIFICTENREEVVGDTGDGFWTKETSNASGQDQITERLYRKKDGKVVRLIVDGKEQPIEESSTRYEVVEERVVDISVPAGFFKADYSKVLMYDEGNSDEKIPLEVWMNKKTVPLDGIIRLSLGEGVIVLSELTAFKKG